MRNMVLRGFLLDKLENGRISAPSNLRLVSHDSWRLDDAYQKSTAIVMDVSCQNQVADLHAHFSIVQRQFTRSALINVSPTVKYKLGYDTYGISYGTRELYRKQNDD